MGDEFEEESEVQRLPTLKVNANDLSWLKEQKPSKDSSLQIQALGGEAVRCAAARKSQFYVAPVSPKDDFEDAEEVKSSLCSTEPAPLLALYCECGNLCEPDLTLCNACAQKQEPVEISGSLYMQSNRTLKYAWIHLINKELYCTLNYSRRLQQKR